ncbi:MAG: hypothetical protein U5K29_05055 [Acidimicrobiales bacterium]|nr:hypothetical protein [Acidimicrobiales bacterium]
MSAHIDHRHLSRILGVSRAALGVALLVAPRLTARGWVGDQATSGSGKVALRALGIRDVAIGYGTVHAIDSGDPNLRQWVTLAGLCDLTDATATVLAFHRLPKRGRFLALTMAAAAAAVAFVARDRLE